MQGYSESTYLVVVGMIRRRGTRGHGLGESSERMDKACSRGLKAVTILVITLLTSSVKMRT